MSEIKVDRVVDARGSHCPGPLMELIKTIRNAKIGEVIAVYSTDSGSKTDIPRWVEKAGHQLIGVYEREGYTEFIVKKVK
ncbi:MAG: sulfurtransferase TusA family protein [Nitrososphaerota archaeon]|nr:sulfurtransferase TusA family protein [Candidatus Geocrenenecus dongiae]